MIRIIAAAFLLAVSGLNGTTWHIDAQNGSDVTGDGSAGKPWATVQEAFGSVVGGDTVLIEPGFYGELRLGRDAGVGSDSTGYVTYLANPATCTPRPAHWFEDTLVPPDPDDPQGKVIFSYVRFASYSDDMDTETKTGTPVGHYTVLEGVNVVGNHIRLISYVSNVVVRDCNVFGEWADYDEGITFDGGIAIYAYWAYGSDYRDILVEGCYTTHTQRGVHLTGNQKNVTVRNCHFRHFSGTAISLGIGIKDSADRVEGNVVIGGNHAHGQVMVPYGNGTPQVITAVDADEPARRFTVSGPGKTHPFFIAVTSAATGSTEIRWRESWDGDSLLMTLAEPLSFTPVVGDSVRLHDATHGSGIGNTGDFITYRGNRIHDCGGTRPFYIYGGGTGLVLENNLIYDGYNHLTVDFNNKLGNGCRIVNNTFAGFRHSNYYGNNNGRDAYGLAMRGTGVQAGTDPSTIIIANNVLVGTGSATDGAVVKNNIVYSGSSFEEDTEGLNSGNKVYCVDPDAGTEPHPFETDSGFFVGGPGFDDGFVENHAMNFNVFFKLTAGSEAVGFADPSYAPLKDMTGADRDGAPDAGCYEWDGTAIDIPVQQGMAEGLSVPNPLARAQLREIALRRDIAIRTRHGETVNLDRLQPGVYLVSRGKTVQPVVVLP